MDAASRVTTLTVLLSFPGLFKWLKKHRNEQIAEMVRRSLWRELREFAKTNFDVSGGALKPNSPLSRLTPKVGIIVEVNRLPLTDIAEAFCCRSVLALPPFNEAEVRRMWDDRIGIPVGDGVVTEVLHQTGGHPWFVDLLLGSVALQQPDLTKGDDAKVQESLARASKLAETLLQRTDGANGLPEELRDRVQKYVKNLERILTPETRTDSGELDQLEGGTIKEVPLSSNARSEEWLESGLIWACPPPNEPNGLLGFAHYPFLRTRRHGTLVSLLIAQLMSGEKSERDEK